LQVNWPVHLLMIASFMLSLVPVSAAIAQDQMTLSSPIIEDQGRLPDQLKCTRDGGDGVSPPLEWTSVPDGSQSFALIMHHYPNGAVAGRDDPSHYWLLWSIPADTRGLPPGNPASIGHEGADKDQRRVGYTPPCSPGGALHEYTITLYALGAPLEALPENDDRGVIWATLNNAMDGKIIETSELTFLN